MVEIYNHISERLTEDRRVAMFATMGQCRRWTSAALKVIKEISSGSGEPIIAEARVVEMESRSAHTFVRIKIETDGTAFIYDGTGVINCSPFFGREDDAPEHLKNSAWDMINAYF